MYMSNSKYYLPLPCCATVPPVKRTVSFGNVLQLRHRRVRRRPSGFLWPNRAVAYGGTGQYKASSGTWYSLEVFTLRDGIVYYYAYDSGPTPQALNTLESAIVDYPNFYGQKGAHGVGWNALGAPKVYDKVTQAQLGDWLAVH